MTARRTLSGRAELLRQRRDAYKTGTGPKYCTKCDTPKPANREHFDYCPHTWDNLQSWCTECCKVSTQKHRVWKVYGITLEERDAMLAAQGGVCSICGQGGFQWGAKRKEIGWNIDHDHSTGAIRSILCGLCNVGIGNLREDAKILRSAIEYLETHAANR